MIYTKLFVIVSTTIDVFFVEKELSHRSSWQANDAIYPFSEVHTMHIKVLSRIQNLGEKSTMGWVQEGDVPPYFLPSFTILSNRRTSYLHNLDL